MRALALVALCALGCGRAAPDETPEGALDAFLSACEAASSDPSAAARAYALLAEPARRALEERARRATSITGKPIAPEQLLVPLYSPFRFEIAKTKSSEGKNAEAIVDVYGPDPATQHVRVPMVREGGRFRVLVDLSR